MQARENGHLRVRELRGLEDETLIDDFMGSLQGLERDERRALLRQIFGFDITADWDTVPSEPVLTVDRLRLKMVLARELALCKELVTELTCRLLELKAMGSLDDDTKEMLQTAIQRETDNIMYLTEHMLTVTNPGVQTR